jgi:hypothetical protein
VHGPVVGEDPYNITYNESLATVAHETGATWQALCAEYNLTNCSFVSVITGVAIPNSPSWPTPPPTPAGSTGFYCDFASNSCKPGGPYHSIQECNAQCTTSPRVCCFASFHMYWPCIAGWCCESTRCTGQGGVITPLTQCNATTCKPCGGNSTCYPTPAAPTPAPAPGVPTPAPPTPAAGGQCTGCIGGSKGECKAPSNVCFPATAGACPAGTTHC